MPVEKNLRFRFCLIPSGVGSALYTKALMTGFIVSTVVYILALAYGSYLLKHHGIEIPRFSRWIILNTVALILSSIAAIPFPPLF